jgi:RimJ/RimL family protein N-acetyltransferase
MLELTSARLQIREIVADDLPALLPVYTSNPEFVQQNEGSEGEAGRYDLDRWQRDWHVMQMLPGSHQLGCYLKPENTPVGIIHFLEENEDDGKPWLGTLVIHKDSQRQGLGTEAFRCLAEHFRQQTDWTVLRAGVKAQNEPGLAFLKHLGFKSIKEGSGRFAGGIQTFFVMEFQIVR